MYYSKFFRIIFINTVAIIPMYMIGPMAGRTWITKGRRYRARRPKRIAASIAFMYLII